MYCVGVAEKITGTGNVDTINISRLVISVSLMLFSSTTHKKEALASKVCVSVWKNRKSRTVLVRDVARLRFSFLLLFAFCLVKRKKKPLHFRGRMVNEMANNHQTRIEIRGLSEKEITYLKALAKEQKAKSFNAFLLAMCREKIEKEKFNLVEANYLAHLENMKLTSDHVLFLTQKQTVLLSDFEEKMSRYADHISRWLEYEGEVESSD